MSALPPETGLGYTPPVVRQLSVFLENKVGRLHDMLEVFQREPGLELCAISVLEASEHSVVRLISTNIKLASDLLKEDGWAFTATDLLVVRLQTGTDHRRPVLGPPVGRTQPSLCVSPYGWTCKRSHHGDQC